jgi:L-aspartate oxidase
MRVVSDIRPSDKGELDLVDVRSSLRSAMWRNVGIVRAGNRLADALDMIHFWCRYSLDKIFDDLSGWEIQNMLSCAALVATAARAREESRGTHTRSDFPSQRAAELHHRLYRITELKPELRAVAAGGAVQAGDVGRATASLGGSEALSVVPDRVDLGNA